MSQTKQKDKFEEKWKGIVQKTSSEAPEKMPKVPNSEVAAIFQEIAEERVKKARETYKTKLAGILEAKLELDKTLTKGRNELKQKEEKEYETLNKALEEAERMLDNVKKEGKNLTDASEGNFTSENLEE